LQLPYTLVRCAAPREQSDRLITPIDDNREIPAQSKFMIATFDPSFMLIKEYPKAICFNCMLIQDYKIADIKRHRSVQKMLRGFFSYTTIHIGL
jgi:hypothetical protein